MLFITLFLSFLFIKTFHFQFCDKSITYNEECSCSKSLNNILLSCTEPSTRNSFFSVKLSSLNTLTLRVEQKNYPIIPAKSFQGLKMKTISLNNCQIKYIDKNAFDGILLLNELVLTRNYIESLNNNIFKNLINLTSLNLGQNPIATFEPRCFQQLKNLRSLILNNNNALSALTGDEFFYGLSNLESVSLNSGNIREISNISFAHLISLNRISIQMNKIKNFQVTKKETGFKATELNLFGNRLEILKSKMFLAFENLRSLILGNNLISLIEPDAFYGLVKLERLNLETNKLVNFQPGTFLYLKSLKIFYINENLFERFDNTTFADIKALNDTSFSRNTYVRLIGQYTFSNFDQVKILSTLNFGQQRIAVIESFAFYGLSHSIIITLDDNMLKRIENFTFYGMNSLAEISLKENLIISIEINAFRGLKNLIELNFEANRIEILNDGVFQDLPKLKYLYLLANYIKQFDSNQFSGSNSIIKIVLDSNFLQRFNNKSINFIGLKNSLEIINLNACKFLNIRSNFFSHLTSLILINLEENQLTAIDHDAFFYLTELSELSLRNNFLFRIDRRLFINNKKLKYLNLEENVLFQIHENTFQNLNMLSVLNLRSNRIINLTYLHLANSTKSLTVLNLNSNELKTFNLDKQTSLVNLNLEIFLANNKLVSTEGVYQLKYLDVKNNFNLAKLSWKFLSKLDLSNNKNIFNIENQKVLFKDLRTLKLANTSLKLINALNFSFFQNLIVLDMSHIYLDAITVEKISLIKTLRELYLVNTKLNFALEFPFIQFEKIDLSNNLDLKVNDSAFLVQSTGSLTSMVLSNINLVTVPNLSQFKLIQNVNLSFNHLTEIKLNCFENNLEINYLSLSNNKISFIENNAFINQRFLFVIDLSHNDLISFSDNSKMIYTQKFIANNNLNLEIQSWVDSPNLEEIRLFDCKLTRVLSVYSRKPFNFYMSSNKIKMIGSDDFKNVPRLRNLYLDNNLISLIEPNSFALLRFVNRIDLSRNFIQILDENIFEDTYNLVYLNLSKNLIETMPLGLFSNLNKLETLDLSFNLIKFVQINLLLSNGLLKNLYLNDNFNILLPSSVFSGLKSIKNIYISPNFFSINNGANLDSILLPVRFVKSGFNHVYMDSIYLIFLPQNFVYTFEFCELSLFLIGYELHFNLRTDYDMNRFLLYCRSKIELKLGLKKPKIYKIF